MRVKVSGTGLDKLSLSGAPVIHSRNHINQLNSIRKSAVWASPEPLSRLRNPELERSNYQGRAAANASMALRVTKDKAYKLVVLIAMLFAAEANDYSFDQSTFLTVVVGVEPNQKRFSIHEGIICARSEFFRRVMSGDWLEKEERLVELPEDDPDIFALYVNIVYMSQVPTNAIAETKTPDALSDELHELCVLYLLCEKMLDKMGKNAILQAIMSTGKEGASDGKIYLPRAETVAVMYAGTPVGSLGRKLLAQMWVALPHDSFLVIAQQLPKDFLIDYTAVLLQARSVPKKSWQDHESSFLEEVD
jgi:hypothetical protein